MTPYTDLKWIHRLIADGEHQQQDFKYEISDARKIARTFSAFANTQGGRLLIGVKDNGRIAGVRSAEEAYMIEAATQMYCTPPVEFSMHTYTIDKRQILITEISESRQKPVFAKDENGKLLAYIRIKDENILANPVQLKVWRQENNLTGELITFTEREQLLLKLLETNVPLSLNRYCKKAGISRKSAEHLLAKFIRFGIVESVFENRKFLFKLK